MLPIPPSRRVKGYATGGPVYSTTGIGLPQGLGIKDALNYNTQQYQLGLDNTIANNNYDISKLNAQNTATANADNFQLGQLGALNTATATDNTYQLGQGRLALDSITGDQNYQMGQGRLGLDSTIAGQNFQLGQGRLGLDSAIAGQNFQLGQGRLGLDSTIANQTYELNRRKADADVRSSDADLAAKQIANRSAQRNFELSSPYNTLPQYASVKPMDAFQSQQYQANKAQLDDSRLAAARAAYADSPRARFEASLTAGAGQGGYQGSQGMDYYNRGQQQERQNKQDTAATLAADRSFDLARSKLNNDARAADQNYQIGQGNLKLNQDKFNFKSDFLNRAGKSFGFANGGRVDPHPVMPSDTVPAMLTPGEFVLSVPAVKQIGADKLNRINKAAQGLPMPKGYAQGGGVQQSSEDDGGFNMHPGTGSNAGYGQHTVKGGRSSGEGQFTASDLSGNQDEDAIRADYKTQASALLQRMLGGPSGHLAIADSGFIEDPDTGLTIPSKNYDYYKGELNKLYYSIKQQHQQKKSQDAATNALYAPRPGEIDPSKIGQYFDLSGQKIKPLAPGQHMFATPGGYANGGPVGTFSPVSGPGSTVSFAYNRDPQIQSLLAQKQQWAEQGGGLPSPYYANAGATTAANLQKTADSRATNDALSQKAQAEWDAKNQANLDSAKIKDQETKAWYAQHPFQSSISSMGPANPSQGTYDDAYQQSIAAQAAQAQRQQWGANQLQAVWDNINAQNAAAKAPQIAKTYADNDAYNKAQLAAADAKLAAKGVVVGGATQAKPATPSVPKPATPSVPLYQPAAQAPAQSAQAKPLVGRTPEQQAASDGRTNSAAVAMDRGTIGPSYFGASSSGANQDYLSSAASPHRTLARPDDGGDGLALSVGASPNYARDPSGFLTRIIPPPVSTQQSAPAQRQTPSIVQQLLQRAAGLKGYADGGTVDDEYDEEADGLPSPYSKKYGQTPSLKNRLHQAEDSMKGAFTEAADAIGQRLQQAGDTLENKGLVSFGKQLIEGPVLARPDVESSAIDTVLYGKEGKPKAPAPYDTKIDANLPMPPAPKRVSDGPTSGVGALEWSNSPYSRVEYTDQGNGAISRSDTDGHQSTLKAPSGLNWTGRGYEADHHFNEMVPSSPVGRDFNETELGAFDPGGRLLGGRVGRADTGNAVALAEALQQRDRINRYREALMNSAGPQREIELGTAAEENPARLQPLVEEVKSGAMAASDAAKAAVEQRKVATTEASTNLSRNIDLTKTMLAERYKQDTGEAVTKFLNMIRNNPDTLALAGIPPDLSKMTTIQLGRVIELFNQAQQAESENQSSWFNKAVPGDTANQAFRAGLLPAPPGR